MCDCFQPLWMVQIGPHDYNIIHRVPFREDREDKEDKDNAEMDHKIKISQQFQSSSELRTLATKQHKFLPKMFLQNLEMFPEHATGACRKLQL